MKKGVSTFLSIVLLFSIILTGCNSENKLSARETWEAYQELSKYGFSQAFEEYGYCSDPERAQELLHSEECLTSSNLLSWEKLNEGLYAAIYKLWVRGMDFDYIEINAIHFVVLIDGEYKVTFLEYIPEELKEGVDLAKYYDYAEQFQEDLWDQLDSDYLTPIQTWDAYYAAAKEYGIGMAHQQYGYCNNAEKSDALASSYDIIVDAEIHEWKKLGDTLFAVTSEIRGSENNFEPIKKVDFIALVDDKFKVMDVDSIPMDQRKGVDLSPYYEQAKD